jgi:hypothetical protein
MLAVAARCQAMHATLETIMTNKVNKTAAEIQKWLHETVHKIESVNQSHARIEVPVPQWHEPDEEQRNWNIDAFTNAQGHEDALFRTVQDARSRYWLEKME